MRRLSMMDVDNGAQPATKQDNRVQGVSDGEIYNLAEVRCGWSGADTATCAHNLIPRSPLIRRITSHPPIDGKPGVTGVRFV